MPRSYRDSIPLLLRLLYESGRHAAARTQIRFTDSGIVADADSYTEVTAPDPADLSEARIREALQRAAGSVEVNGQRITNVGDAVSGRSNVISAKAAEDLVGLGGFAEGDAITLGKAKAYTDAEFADFESYADAGDAATLDAAESYADSVIDPPHFASEAFTSSGKWTCPAGIDTALVVYWGAGGGGGGGAATAPTGADRSQAAGGGAARKQISIIHPTPGEDYAVTIGAVGAAGTGVSGASGTDGGKGGDTAITGLGVDLIGFGAYGGTGGQRTGVTSPGYRSPGGAETGPDGLSYTDLRPFLWPGFGGPGLISDAGDSADGLPGQTSEEGFAGGAAGAGVSQAEGSGGGAGGPGGTGGDGADGKSFSAGPGTGNAGSDAPANSGAGGGGGGHSTQSGAFSNIGGAGGKGGSGFVEILWVET